MTACTRPGWAGDFEYGFCLGGRPPDISEGERVYIVAHGFMRGYAPLSHIERAPVRFGGRPTGFALVRRGAAVACTLGVGHCARPGARTPIRGFQGW